MFARDDASARMRRPMPLRWTHVVILTGNLAFCVTGLFVPALPSWRMFEHVPDPRYELVDAGGKPYRVEDYLPRDAYNFRPETLASVARFICEREPVRAPLTLSAGRRRFGIERADGSCVVREQIGAPD